MKEGKRIYPLYMEMHHARLVSMYSSKSLQKQSPVKPVKFVSTSQNGTNQVETIKKLMEVYHLLCEISSLINQHFQLQMLCFSFNTFLSIVFNIYYILIFRGIIANSIANGTQGLGHIKAMESLIIFMIISIIGCIMDILCIVCACEHTVNAVGIYLSLIFF